MPVAGRGNQDYCDWWHDQFMGQDNLHRFGMRLVRDASTLELFTPTAHIDLAYCRSACYSTFGEYPFQF